MQARLFKARSIELALDTHEEAEVTPTDSGFEFNSYSMWSESFAAWVKQDLDYLKKYYSDDYEKLCNRIDKKLKERGLV